MDFQKREKSCGSFRKVVPKVKREKQLGSATNTAPNEDKREKQLGSSTKMPPNEDKREKQFGSASKIALNEDKREKQLGSSTKMPPNEDKREKQLGSASKIALNEDFNGCENDVEDAYNDYLVSEFLKNFHQQKAAEYAKNNEMQINELKEKAKISGEELTKLTDRYLQVQSLYEQEKELKSLNEIMASSLDYIASSNLTAVCQASSKILKGVVCKNIEFPATSEEVEKLNEQADITTQNLCKLKDITGEFSGKVSKLKDYIVQITSLEEEMKSLELRKERQDLALESMKTQVQFYEMCIDSFSRGNCGS